MTPASIDEMVKRIVDERLRELGVAPSYSSTSLPPGITSREHFASECRRLRVGAKHGRVWIVGADEWRCARSASRKPALRVVPSSEVDRADAYLDACGTRATRGKR